MFTLWAQDLDSIPPPSSPSGSDSTQGSNPEDIDVSVLDTIVFRGHCGTTIFLPKCPPFAPIPIAKVPNQLGIPHLKFPSALCAFLEVTRPDLLKEVGENLEVSVFTNADLCLDPIMDPHAFDIHDCLHAFPPTAHVINCEGPDCGHFDTVLVRKNPKGRPEFGMEKHLVARLRVIFRFSGPIKFNEPLAYVEWFTEPECDPDSDLQVYRVHRKFESGQRSASVIRLLDVRRGCRLLPDFADPSAHAVVMGTGMDEMLDTCDTFFVDKSLDEHSFLVLS